MEQIKCKIENCNYESKKLVKGMCISHWRQSRRGTEFNVSNNKARRLGFAKDDFYYLPLGIGAKGGYAKVDLYFSHLEKHNWSCTKLGHCYRTRYRTEEGSKTKFLHHEIIGKPDSNFVVDHIDRDPKNNTFSNLRITTKSENAINSSKVHGQIKVKGVNWSKRDKLYSARIIKDNQLFLLGSYKELNEAINARKEGELKYWGYNP